MAEQNVPTFSEEQKRYFAQQLHEQSGKPVIILPREVMTNEQLATQARETGDFLAVKNNPAVRNAFIEKFGAAGYGDLHKRYLASERDKRADEARVKLEERKRRLGIR